MNDRNEVEKVQSAIDTTFSYLKDDPWLAQKVLNGAREETHGRKKLPAGLVLAVVLALAFATFAAALTINLFEQYGRKDQRLFKIAPQAELAPVTAVVDDSATVTVLNAYYDGSSLILGYAIDEPERTDFFTPTGEQLSQMQPAGSGQCLAGANGLEASFREALEAAKQKKTPIGVVKTRISLSDSAFDGNGTDLGTWNEANEYADGNRYAAIRDFDHLPESTRGLERLSVILPLRQSKAYVYYDGQTMYTMEEEMDTPPLSLVVERSSGSFEHFEGEGVYNGIRITCLVEASDVHLSALITAKDAELPDLPEDCWYDMCLRDENGLLIEASGFEEQKGHALLFTFDAAGKPLGTLTACLQVVGGEDGTDSFAIPLKKKNEAE